MVPGPQHNHRWHLKLHSYAEVQLTLLLKKEIVNHSSLVLWWKTDLVFSSVLFVCVVVIVLSLQVVLFDSFSTSGKCPNSSRGIFTWSGGTYVQKKEVWSNVKYNSRGLCCRGSNLVSCMAGKDTDHYTNKREPHCLWHSLVSIVVSIPTCHMGDWGLNPYRGVHIALK